MKFSIYKASSYSGSLILFGTINASCQEVAADLFYKLIRRSKRAKNGDVFLIVPMGKTTSIDSLMEDGTPFHIVQYREIE
ncbi:hypothetical protein [Bacillus sp. B-jedd]|uniref:hypothetical protein n=1 Tax=Bacillus sp. B-jedd TaxID=1476857 RepID=UPI0005155E6E|nr:hypothetical protein [Bacillus sp. B-jedd]CEG28354.1 hypothetical protein BN1002_03269 [Bacillus sp. B-jedd]